MLNNNCQWVCKTEPFHHKNDMLFVMVCSFLFSKKAQITKSYRFQSAWRDVEKTHWNAYDFPFLMLLQVLYVIFPCFNFHNQCGNEENIHISIKIQFLSNCTHQAHWIIKKWN